jgi:decaprenyl-phosphate phosphoribosyltransferase
METFKNYIAIARPDHWFKNIFMLPGTALALTMSSTPVNQDVLINIFWAVISTCLIASANYTINEWLDAEYDKFHPVKHNRPSVAGNLSPFWVYSQWIILSTLGLSLANLLGMHFFLYSLALLVMGVLYNVRPFRTKDRIYLDVLSESINNPLRFMLGWAAVVSNIIPPSSVLLAYWMGGAFLMAIKRYAEFRFIGDAEKAGLYRRSFKFYTEDTLMLSAFFYALTSAFFFGVFLIRYKVEFLLTVPFLALLFVWYMAIGMRKDSVTQRPEKLYQERRFMVYLVFLGILVTTVFFIDIPWLDILLNPVVLD